jgi:N-formylglutamate amidohydrolase
MSATDFDPPFEIRRPVRWRSPFVFDVPHAGRFYPNAFLAASRLDAVTLRRSEDAFVDDLVRPVVALGAPMLTARFPRAYLDVNREPFELDPRLFDGRLPAFANTRSMRVAGGLGTVPRLVGDGQEIYAGRLPVQEGLMRVDALYKPYHAALRGLIDETARRFGCVVLVDCHSMPIKGLGRESGKRPDVILGDRFGTSCAGSIVTRFEEAFRGRGYHVVRNRPYAGGFITEHYGEPLIGRHALQIEIARPLYMDERTLEPHSGFTRLAQDLGAIFAGVMAEIPQGLHGRPLAAE